MSAEKARALVSKELASSHVLLFSKTFCPYCVNAKKIFAKYNVEPGIVELDQMSNGSEIQSKLAEITGQRTVPNIFIGNKHIGGCDDTKKLDSQGKLAELLQH